MTAHRKTHRTLHMLFVTTLTACIFSGCSFVQLFIPPDGLNVLPAKDFNAAISKGDVLLIDVHTPEQAHIKGTDHLIPHKKLAEHLEKFPSDKSLPVYLYCKTGHMVNVAARTLFSQGYTNVYNLEGGTKAWGKAGFTVDE
jgi:rhodanese-related sulfurtransferase